LVWGFTQKAKNMWLVDPALTLNPRLRCEVAMCS